MDSVNANVIWLLLIVALVVNPTVPFSVPSTVAVVSVGIS